MTLLESLKKYTTVVADTGISRPSPGTAPRTPRRILRSSFMPPRCPFTATWSMRPWVARPRTGAPTMRSPGSLSTGSSSRSDAKF